MGNHVKFVGALLIFFGWTAMGAGPKFKDNPTNLGTFQAGQTIDLDLRDFLKEPGTPPLNWFGSSLQPLPSWLKIDSANNRIHGTPAASNAGTHQFLISVTDATGEGGDINHPTTVTVLAPPTWKINPVDLGFQNEGMAWSLDLNTLVTNPAGGSVTYTASGLPNWMGLNGSTLSGTPKRSDVGSYSNIVLTASGIGGSTQASAFGEVLKVIQPPKWTGKNIDLGSTKEDQPFSRDVSTYVVNPEGATLSYEIVSQTPPAWLQLGLNSGTLFGTPTKPNLGQITVTAILRATLEGQEYTDTTNFSIQVEHVNHAPQWLANPLTLPSGASGVAYTQPLNQSFRDVDDGDTHTFEILPDSGPSWLSINPQTGSLSGTPGKTHVGKNSWLVKVTDQAGASSTTLVEFQVIKSNEPPRWVMKPTLLPEAKEDSPFDIDLNQAKYVVDPDGDPLTFSKLDGPNWFNITAKGQLMGLPGAAQVGLHKFQVKVSDNISGSDIAEIQFLVLHVNHKPEWFLNPIRISAKEDSPLQASIAQYVRDVDPNDSLEFSAIEGDPWAQLSKNGTFTGTPGALQAGKQWTYTVRVMDKEGATADVTVIIDVEHVNHKPFWSGNPIKLNPNAFEGQTYSQSVAAYATDPDNDPLEFAKVDGPAWVSISRGGVVSGTPSRADVGTHTFRVRATDPSLEFATTTFEITVEKVNKVPRWRQNPILLSDGFENREYRFDLSKFATDDDGDALDFALVSGPAWIQVSPAGIITGKPATADIGNFTATFSVTDNQSDPVLTQGTGQVLDINQEPVIGSIPLFQVKEREILDGDLNAFVTDPDGDKLNYVLQGAAPSWFKLNADGTFKLDRPQYKDLGDHAIAFKVDDGEFPKHGVVNVRVIRNPRPPRWTQDPVRFTAKTNQPFLESLRSYAVDEDSIPLNFSKVEGIAPWLNVSVNGDVSGTPRNENMGDNVFVVRVCNDLLCADAGMIITVKPGTIIDEIAVDSVVPGARADNLWVLDNSQTCSKLVSSLKRNVKYYYEALNAAQIHHAGILISADAHEFNGLPIHDSQQAKLFTWTLADIVEDFRIRANAGFSGGGCGNCYNSPIWSMHRFYERVPSISEVYHNGYLERGVPMDALIVTRQRDHYGWYTKYLPDFKNWNAGDFAQSFKNFHEDEGQPYRISTITPKCPHLVENTGEKNYTAPADAYDVLVDATGGTSYVYDCNYDLKTYLEDYAKQVIFRAYVTAKKSIKLSKQPIETQTMKVWVGQVELSSPDQWRYDGNTNRVELYWDKISVKDVRPGDQIRIEYRVS